MLDMIRKNRSVGKKGKPRLTDAQVKCIRNRYAEGESQISLASYFEVNPITICRIVNGKTHV